MWMLGQWSSALNEKTDVGNRCGVNSGIEQEELSML